MSVLVCNCASLEVKGVSIRGDRRDPMAENSSKNGFSEKCRTVSGRILGRVKRDRQTSSIESENLQRTKAGTQVGRVRWHTRSLSQEERGKGIPKISSK